MRRPSGTGAGRIDEQSMLSIIRQEMDNSIIWSGGATSDERRRLMNLYLGGPRGDERPGRSKVVSRAAYESVEWAKPLLIETFFSGPDVCVFQPNGPEDEEQARQRTDYTNYIFTRKNDGFRATLDATSDALIRRVGWVKVWHEEVLERTRERYYGKTEDEIADILESEDGWEVSAAIPADPIQIPGAPGPDGSPVLEEVKTYDVEVVRTVPKRGVRVVGVPPSEVFMNPDARSPYDDTCRFIQHRQKTMTRSKAIALGFDSEKVSRIPPNSGVFGQWDSEERDVALRLRGASGVFSQNARSDGEAQITINECYARVDIDGDGITEWCVVWVGGDYGEIFLDWEPVSQHPFAQFQVIPLPHSAEGLSIVDTVDDIQDIETTVKRMWLDNIYFAVQGRWDVRVQGQPGEPGVPLVDMQQLASAIPGSWVYTWADGALKPIAAPIDLEPFQDAFGRLVEDRQRRTGISPDAFGLDPEMMSNSARGVEAQTSAAQIRTMLMAIVLAEGLKRVFQLIDSCVLKNPEQETQLRLRGQWVKVNPADWRGKMDCEVAANIGSGSRTARASRMGRFIAVMGQVKSSGYPGVTDENVHNALRELAVQIGLRAPEQFITDPKTIPPEIPKPDPTDVAISYEHHIKAMQLEVEKVKVALEAKKAELQHERELKKLELDHSLKIGQLERDEEYRIAEMGAKGQIAVDFGAIRDSAERMQGAADAIKQSMIDNPTLRAMASLQSTMSRPKRIVRGPDGRMSGIEPAPETE